MMMEAPAIRILAEAAEASAPGHQPGNENRIVIAEASAPMPSSDTVRKPHEVLSAEQNAELAIAANIGPTFDIKTINLAELGRRFPYKRGQPRHTKVMKEAVQRLQGVYEEAAAAAPHARHYEALARQYFVAWNARDIGNLMGLLTVDVTLRDWEVEKIGRDDVAAAHALTFVALPRISIEVHMIHVAEKTLTAICETLVRLHNTEDEKLRVVHVMQFNSEQKIAAVRAYKG